MEIEHSPLQEKSEILFNSLVKLIDNKPAELAELLVKFGLVIIKDQKKYENLSQLNFEDYLEATELIIAMLEVVSEQQLH